MSTLTVRIVDALNVANKHVNILRITKVIIFIVVSLVIKPGPLKVPAIKGER